MCTFCGCWFDQISRLKIPNFLKARRRIWISCHWRPAWCRIMESFMLIIDRTLIRGASYCSHETKKESCIIFNINIHRGSFILFWNHNHAVNVNDSKQWFDTIRMNKFPQKNLTNIFYTNLKNLIVSVSARETNETQIPPMTLFAPKMSHLLWIAIAGTPLRCSFAQRCVVYWSICLAQTMTLSP